MKIDCKCSEHQCIRIEGFGRWLLDKDGGYLGIKCQRIEDCLMRGNVEPIKSEFDKGSGEVPDGFSPQEWARLSKDEKRNLLLQLHNV